MDKTKWKILVPGNMNHDSHTFFGVDKLGQFVRRPSNKKQISSSGKNTRHGREGSGVVVSESRRPGVQWNCWSKPTHPEDD